jgi:hypothetical protein
MVNINIKEGIDTLSSTNNFIPTGSLIMKASAPSALANYDTDVKCINAGFIPCDGRTLNATTYPLYQDLFDIVGNIYGGSGNTAFKVPDLRTSRRYIYGQPTASSGVYTPSFSANTTNGVTHSHSINTSNTSLNSPGFITDPTNGAITNGTGIHNHSISYTFSDGGSDYHSHYWNVNYAGLTTGGPNTGALTKGDGTGTAAGGSHTHNMPAFTLQGNTGNGGASHSHSGSVSTTAGNFNHSHTLNGASGVAIPVSSAIDIPYINMLYFIKI